MKDRLTREQETLQAMVALFCQEHHRPEAGLCDDCLALLAYAGERLSACPFGAQKPTCRRCPIHCYPPARREQVRAVMRYAGPRLPLRHPWLAFLHLLDRFRKAPPSPQAFKRGSTL